MEDRSPELIPYVRFGGQSAQKSVQSSAYPSAAVSDDTNPTGPLGQIINALFTVIIQPVIGATSFEIISQ